MFRDNDTVDPQLDTEDILVLSASVRFACQEFPHIDLARIHRIGVVNDPVHDRASHYTATKGGCHSDCLYCVQKMVG